MAAISEDDKKKLYILGGLLGVLAVVFGVMYLPGMLSGGGDDLVPPTPSEEVSGPPPGELPPGDVPPGDVRPAGDVGGAPPAVQAAGFSLLAAESARPDPFVPFYRRVQTPTLPTGNQGGGMRVPGTERTELNVVQLPVDLPSPQDVLGGDVALPPFDLGLPGVTPGVAISRPGQASARSRVLVGLPPARISQVSREPGQPDLRRAMPPVRSTSGVAEVVDPDTIRESTNKRLSGVIIGDGIHAILEISTGAAGAGAELDGQAAPATRTHVVQPGDVVDGIRIVRIERYTEGARTGTRMLINEGGQDRWVELKAAPQGAMPAPLDGAPPIGFPRTGALPGGAGGAQGGLVARGGNSQRNRPRTSNWGPPPPP